LKSIEIFVLQRHASPLKKILKKSGLPYTMVSADVSGKKGWHVSIILPDELVNDTIQKISNAVDLRRKENIITIRKVEGSVSRDLERQADKAKKEKVKSPIESILESTKRYIWVNKDLLSMAMIAGLVALAGLFLDNPVLIIGAMLLAPVLGPINAISVNICLGRLKAAIRANVAILILIGAVIGLSAATTAIASQFISLPTTGEILTRTKFELVDLAIVLLLGLAGGLALVTELSEILAGVAIAAALLPPAAVAGIELAIGNASLFYGSLTLVVASILGLTLGNVLAFVLKGIHPRRYYQQEEAKKYTLYFAVAISTLIIILVLVSHFM
jgi:uncharacterized hydrophobic protein (TIGR00341 family)